jgi:hypothetical protein
MTWEDNYIKNNYGFPFFQLVNVCFTENMCTLGKKGSTFSQKEREIRDELKNERDKEIELVIVSIENRYCTQTVLAV